MDLSSLPLQNGGVLGPLLSFSSDFTNDVIVTFCALGIVGFVPVLIRYIFRRG